MTFLRKMRGWSLGTTTALVLAACAGDDVSAPATASPVSESKPSADASTTDATPVPGLRAEYFDGYHDLDLARVEPAIEHAWKDGAPGAGIGKDRFSARWTGMLTAKKAGKTTIGIDGDDGVRVWIDDRLVIDDWRAHFEERHTAEIELDPGKAVRLEIEYFEVDLDAQIRLFWSGPELPEETIPTTALTTLDRPSGKPGPKPPIANPVVGSDCPDPGVLADGGTYYMVCTGGRFAIKTSRDLVTWANAANAFVLPSGKPAWAANGGRNWAPELHKVGDQFLAYYTSVNGADVLSIGVAHAPKPTGPFTDKGAPLVEDGKGVIDATFFEDDDGSRWLFYKIDGNATAGPTPIFVRKLAADGLSFAPGSAPKEVLRNASTTWEGGVVEAPWVVKRNGRYYMFYSGNVYDDRYRTGVARATSLTGPWEKKGAPILANNGTWVGPGHGSVVAVPTIGGPPADYFVYHAWRAEDRAKGRMVLLDRIEWANGWPRIGNGTPTVGSQPWPGTP